jgi:spermidine/putrescine transport system ATP-binding protein
VDEPVTSDIAVNIIDLTKLYGSFVALENVSLDIRDNEFFTLLGPSGCGKTTLLRAIAGFEKVSEGRIELFGEEIENLAPHQRPVNTVFQHYALFPHMTVSENIAYGLKRLCKSDSEIQKTIKAMLALVQMQDFGDRKPTNMSGGQMQRVALARALAPHPKVLLLDEPLSALDLKLRQAMREELQRLQRETGITFIFVTHDQDEALSMSDRIAVMSEGKIQQVGGPEEIYQQPANRFVADFIGDTNIIDVSVISKTVNTTFYKTETGIELNIKQSSKLEPGTRVALNIRPENVIIKKPGKGIASGTLINKTFLGRTSIYSIKLKDGTIIKSRHSNHEGHSDKDSEIGASVGMDFVAKSVAVLTS